jgi:hypothetical protein
MSKGPAIAGGGAFLCWTAGFGCLWTAFPSIRPFIGAAYGLGLLGLLLVVLRMKRRMAQAECQVQMQRKATAREQWGLWLGIPLGVAAVIALAISHPKILEIRWIGPVSSTLFLLLVGGYFLVLAVQVRLFEPAIMGVAVAALSFPALYVSSHPITEELLQKMLIAILGTVGILQIALGASLHRRWVAWRTESLNGGAETLS